MLDVIAELHSKKQLPLDLKDKVLQRPLTSLVFHEIDRLDRFQLMQLMDLVGVEIGYNGYPVVAMEDDEIRTEFVIFLRSYQRKTKLFNKRKRRDKHNDKVRLKNKVITLLGG